VAYEELPRTWQSQTWTTSRNTQAFALTVEGDSMMPQLPCRETSWCCRRVMSLAMDDPVVAKLKDDGIVFQHYTRLQRQHHPA